MQVLSSNDKCVTVIAGTDSNRPQLRYVDRLLRAVFVSTSVSPGSISKTRRPTFTNVRSMLPVTVSLVSSGDIAVGLHYRNVSHTKPWSLRIFRFVDYVMHVCT